MNLRPTYRLFALIFLLPFLSTAQLEASIWYFGENAGLDFRSGTPVILTDGQLDTAEGCATISDGFGNLLFYTDGREVRNRDHEIMPDGTDLKGHFSSTQSAIIVPNPGDPNIYYLFTVTTVNGIYYSIIDMRLNGGLGGLAQKNIPLKIDREPWTLPGSEKLTSVLHANGQDIWVLSHGWRNDEFYAYLVTSAGVESTSVTSHVGIDFTEKSDPSDDVGYLKASPDGSKLAICHRLVGAELLDFDSATGQVSNAITLKEDLKFYGAEFSPSSQVLYISDEWGDIFQYDLNAPDIKSTELNISEGTANLRTGGLQLGIDGRIYISEGWTNYMSVIQQPNVLGAGCLYKHNAIDMGGLLCKMGLPQFIQSYFFVSDIQATNMCFGESTEFMINVTEPITSILWDFGDGNTSNMESPAHTYMAPGNYTVEVIVTTDSGTEVKTRDITISEVPTAGHITNVEFCTTASTYDFDLSTLDNTILGTQDPLMYRVRYFETNEAAQTNINPLDAVQQFDRGSTSIFARISNIQNPDCFDTVSFDVLVKQAPELFVPTDWVVCDDDGDGSYLFDLTAKDVEILNGQDGSVFNVFYYRSQSDADNRTNPLPSDYSISVSNETIFYRIENTVHPECFETGNFTLGVIYQVVANKPSNLDICDTDNDGTVEFDLSQAEGEILGAQSASSVIISYHASLADAETNSDALPIQYTSDSYQKTVYVRVSNASDTSCYATNSFQLNIYDVPEVPEVSDWPVCDDNNDGRYTFDLDEKGSEILAKVSEASLAFYTSEADATLEQNPIYGNYQNTSSPQTIYFRLGNSNNNSCYSIGSFDLEVFDTPTAYPPADIVVCDEEGTGVYPFDLSQRDEQVLNGMDPSIYEVTYYSSQQDAINDEGALAKENYINSTMTETVYARVHHKALNTCYSITDFELMVNPLPKPDLEEVYVICPDSPQLVLDAGFFESYRWEDGDGNIVGDGQMLNVAALGEYSLTITDTQNGVSCSNTIYFEVISSGAPESFKTTTDGLSDKITLTIDAVGVGNFEYSVDGFNYQVSNQFELFPGTYTVFVRDLLGCRTLCKEVIAIGFQKFFSPNGDNINDYWNIIGAELYSDAQLFLYDRYGKLLVQIAPQGQGWDGTILGRPMPSTDYWFKYVYDGGKTFTGHFSLRR